jgi:hypothetical protein
MIKTPIIIKGILIQKTKLQQKYWVKNPPKNGPRERKIEPIATSQPMYLPLSDSSTLLIKILMQEGIMAAAPIPCKILATKREGNESAYPPAKDAKPKKIIPKQKTLL